MSQSSDEEIGQLLAAMQSGAPDQQALAERLIDAYPDDARLHFLRGSMLAGSGRPIEAHAALSRAVAIQPDFALARFQLGFFELTSGEAARAVATWAPLEALPEDHYLRRFVAGLTHLIQDRFADAVADLEAGIELNSENPPLNGDMRLLIAECRSQIGTTNDEPAEEASATSFLLDQFGSRGTTH